MGAVAASLAAAPPQASARAQRMPLLDAAKGCACLLIVGHHFSRYGPLPAGASTLAPAVFDWLSQYGRLAVQVFLVLAGFLAAASIAPHGRGQLDRPLARVFRRYGRLVMPYLVALSFSVLVAAFARPWLLDDDTVPGAPGFTQLLAHGLLLQDLLGFDSLSTGVWYVAIDFQLFLLALAAIAISELVQRRWPVGAERSRWVLLGLVGLLVIASLDIFNRHEELDITAIYFFGSYGLGMLVFWIGQGERSWRPALLLLMLIGIAALVLEWRSRIAIALATAIVVALLQQADLLGRRGWPAVAAPLVRLGRISYSLFLIHFPMLLLVSALFRRFLPDTPWIDLGGLGIALVLSIAAARPLHRHVECRPVTWRAVGGCFALLLGCGALVMA